MRMVSDASARIGRLSLLRDLYGEVLVPEAVGCAVVVEGTGHAGADEIQAACWIRTGAFQFYGRLRNVPFSQAPPVHGGAERAVFPGPASSRRGGKSRFPSPAVNRRG